MLTVYSIFAIASHWHGCIFINNTIIIFVRNICWLAFYCKDQIKYSELRASYFCDLLLCYNLSPLVYLQQTVIFVFVKSYVCMVGIVLTGTWQSSALLAFVNQSQMKWKWPRRIHSQLLLLLLLYVITLYSWSILELCHQCVKSEIVIITHQ